MVPLVFELDSMFPKYTFQRSVETLYHPITLGMGDGRQCGIELSDFRQLAHILNYICQHVSSMVRQQSLGNSEHEKFHQPITGQSKWLFDQALGILVAILSENPA